MTATSGEESSAFKSLEKQINKELIPSPEGQPMFMFFSAKGKTRAITVFFDSGCSKFIMKDTIPNRELPASLIRKGRFPIGGVGTSLIFAENEYMVAMDTIDGKAQELKGVTVKNITVAANEVITDAPQNFQLRRCKVS